MRVAFLPFTAGAVVVQMGKKAVENIDSIDNLTPICTTLKTLYHHIYDIDKL
jgi:hypothetical protein